MKFPMPSSASGYDKSLADAKQRDPVRRASGVAGLGVFGDKDAVKTVKGFLQDEAEAVRVAAHYSMLLLGQSESIPKLIEYLGSEHHEYRKRAVVALQTASGAGVACNHEDAASCAEAKKAYEAWWKKSGSALSWDAKKKSFVAGKGK
jgi:HEAT repeat protein